MQDETEYTPTTQQVRDAVLMSGKPFDQIVEIDDPYYGYSIYDKYVEPGTAFDRWLTAHDATIRTEQAERDAVIAELVSKGYSQHPHDVPWARCQKAIAAAIRDAAKEEQ